MDLPAHILQDLMNEPALSVEVVRELGGSDITLLETAPRLQQAGNVKRISERHHSLARLLSSGIEPGKAAVICGYTAVTVSILCDDPTFQELLAFYKETVRDQYMEFSAQLAGLSLDALQEMRRRVEEEPEKIGMSMLNDIIKMAADRSGHGPSSSSTQVNIHLDLADRMKMARERARMARTIDITPVRESYGPAGPESPPNREEDAA